MGKTVVHPDAWNFFGGGGSYFPRSQPMSIDGRPRSPQSWEHLLEKDPHGGRRFRIGILVAALIHTGIFAITWPTIAQAPPKEPEQVLIPITLVNLIPPEREVEPIRIDVPLPPPPGPPVIAGPSRGTGRAGDPRIHRADRNPGGTGRRSFCHRMVLDRLPRSRRRRSSTSASTSQNRRSSTRSNRVTPGPRSRVASRASSSSISSSTPKAPSNPSVS